MDGDEAVRKNFKFETEPNLVLFTKRGFPLILMFFFSVPAIINKRRSFRSSDLVALSCLVKSGLMVMPGVLASLALLARMLETVHVEASFTNRGRWRVESYLPSRKQSQIECSVTFGSSDWRVEVTDSMSLDNRKCLLVRSGFSSTPYMTILYFRLSFELSDDRWRLFLVGGSGGDLDIWVRLCRKVCQTDATQSSIGIEGLLRLASSPGGAEVSFDCLNCI